MTSLDLPSLATATTLDIYDMDGLPSLAFPALTSLKTFKLSESGTITTFSLAKVGTLDALDVETNAQLSSFSVPVLTSLAKITLVNNPHLPTCLVDKLRAQLGPQGTPATAVVTGNDDVATCN